MLHAAAGMEETTAAEDAEGSEESAATAASNEELSGTLTFAIWDNNLNDFIEENDMVGKFQEQYPNVDVEVEKIKDDSEFITGRHRYSKHLPVQCVTACQFIICTCLCPR